MRTAGRAGVGMKMNFSVRQRVQTSFGNHLLPVKWAPEVFTPSVKGPECEANRFPVADGKVKDEYDACVSPHSHVSTCHMVHKRRGFNGA